MLLVPKSPEFTWRLQTSAGQPLDTFGVSVTPGNNAMGSWTQLIAGASVTEDVYALAIMVGNNFIASTLRDGLLDVGIDEAGGSSYTVKIPFLTICGAANPQVAAPITFYFPLFIKAGSSIAVRASVNNATVGTVRCYAKLYGKPVHQEATRVGSFVRSFGDTLASSRGTIITAGTTSEGSWTQLGSATAEPLWYWKLGMGIGDATFTANYYFADLAFGDASNKIIIAEDVPISVNSGEYKTDHYFEGDCYRTVPTGALIYGRLQRSNATADTNTSLIAYGMGG
jgi:hypothetical protein